MRAIPPWHPAAMTSPALGTPEESACRVSTGLACSAAAPGWWQGGGGEGEVVEKQFSRSIFWSLLMLWCKVATGQKQPRPPPLLLLGYNWHAKSLKVMHTPPPHHLQQPLAPTRALHPSATVITRSESSIGNSFLRCSNPWQCQPRNPGIPNSGLWRKQLAVVLHIWSKISRRWL